MTTVKTLTTDTEMQAKRNTTLFQHLPVHYVTNVTAATTTQVKHTGVVFNPDLRSETQALTDLVAEVDRLLFFGDPALDSTQFQGLVALARAGVISEVPMDGLPGGFYPKHKKAAGHILASSVRAVSFPAGNIPVAPTVTVSFRPGALVWEQLFPTYCFELAPKHDGKVRIIDPNFIPTGQEHVTKSTALVVYGSLKVIEPSEVFIGTC